MASIVFTKIKSLTDNMRYVARLSRAGDGLGRKAQMSAQQMMTQSPCAPRTYPGVGVDTRAPMLPSDVKK